jgi:hypothetical protein
MKLSSQPLTLLVSGTPLPAYLFPKFLFGRETGIIPKADAIGEWLKTEARYLAS